MIAHGWKRPRCGRIQIQPSRNAADAVSIFVEDPVRDQDFWLSLAPGRSVRPTGQLAFRRIAPHVFELVSVRDSDAAAGPPVAAGGSIVTRDTGPAGTTSPVERAMPFLDSLVDGHGPAETIRSTLHAIIEDHPLGQREQAVLRLLMTALPADGR